MKILRFVARNFEEITSGTFLVIMAVTTFANVMARYLFGYSIQWAEELSRYSFIWVTFLGAALCSKHGRHIVIDFLILAISLRAKIILTILTDIIVAGFMFILIYYGWTLAVFTTTPTATLLIPMSWVLYVVPVSGVIILFRTIENLVKSFRITMKEGR